jgi:hypothetical protein
MDRHEIPGSTVRISHFLSIYELFVLRYTTKRWFERGAAVVKINASLA